MSNRWCFILNPAAGGGYAASLYDEVQDRLDSLEDEKILLKTEYPGHAGEIAEDYLNKGFTRFVVIGGDGTVHETAKALVGKPGAALGVVPAGTGNDYIRLGGFEGPFDETGWDALFRNQVAPVDVGICNGEYFFNGMGLGFDAEMTAAVTEYRERTGKISTGLYTWFIVKTLLGYKEKQMKTILDGEESAERCFLTTCAIGRRFAGSYYMTPRAMADDGLLDVMRISPLRLLERLNILLKVPKGSHLSHRKVDYAQTEKLEIRFDSETAAHLDGELIFSDRFEIGLLPGALKLIIHSGADHFLSRI